MPSSSSQPSLPLQGIKIYSSCIFQRSNSDDDDDYNNNNNNNNNHKSCYYDQLHV